MKLFLHADDFGNSKSISDCILDCFENGPLSSTSVMANGQSFDYACSEFRARCSDREIRLHINLMEGSPCAPVEDVPLLVNVSGVFRHSFQSLLVAYHLAGIKHREALFNQVTTEISAQLKKFRDAFPDLDGISVDSHQHFHMIPFVFRSILKLKGKYNISYMRMPKEMFYTELSGARAKLDFPVNLVKHLLLRILSRKCETYLYGTEIRYTDYFVGVLQTGNMTARGIRRALSAIKNRSRSADCSVEVLLHPGGAVGSESANWSQYPALARYYLSPAREAERSVLKSVEMRNLMSEFQKEPA